MYSRSLNYQWDLNDNSEDYVIAGNDVNNLHMSLKLTYSFPFSN